MQIQIRWSQIDRTESLDLHVNEQVSHAVKHCKDRFTRIDVHLHDDNASKGGGHDKRCTIEARPTGASPLVVEGSGDDVYKLVTAVSKKLERAARSFVDRHRKH